MTFFFFRQLRNILPFFWPLWSVWKFIIILTVFPLWMRCHFFLAAFKILFFVVSFQKLKYRVLVWISLEFTHLLDSVYFVSCQNWVVFSHYFFEYFFILPSFSFLTRTPVTRMLGLLYFYTSQRPCTFFFPSIFFLFFSWVISIILSCSLLIFCVPFLLLSLYTELFICCYIF